MDPFTLVKIFMLSLAIYREARGESWEGKLAVGQTVENRVQDRRWPDNYRDVILQPWQFSSFNKDDPQAFLIPDGDEAVWGECVSAALVVVNSPQDYAAGANHFFAVSIPAPRWADPTKEVLRVGRHVFYKL